MVILTNIERFPSRWQTSSGTRGESRFVSTVNEYVGEAKRSNAAVALVNCDPALTFELAGRLSFARKALPLVALDLVLRRPSSLINHVALPLKRLILRRVDLFIHYFKDVSAYRSVFGIGPERSAFVAFKVNLLKEFEPQPVSDGDYILCFGRTLRDFDTFFAAVEQLSYPAAIPRPDLRALRDHGARFSRNLTNLPANVQILDDDGSMGRMLQIIRGAKTVVVPVLKQSIAASGCSTYLNAMYLGKCVIGSEGPGLSDVFAHGEIISVPPEDPAALAKAIHCVWEDDNLRTTTAAAGRQFAVAAGGEQELYQRVIETVVTWYSLDFLPRRMMSPQAN